MPPRCCFCDQAILGLAGQDTTLDTVLLDSDRRAADAEVIAVGAYGDCHQSCLVASGWGPKWNERKVEFRAAREPIVFQDATIIVLRHHYLPEISAFFADGAFLWFRIDQLKRRKDVAGGSLLPVAEEYHINLTKHPAILREAELAFRSTGVYPILDYVAAFGVTHRMRHPASLEGGRFERIKGMTSENFAEGFLSATAVYRLFVPEVVVRVALRNRQRPR